MSANVHGLLHLPQCVRNLGPLRYHSCFQFENANGELLKAFHGLEKQVCDITAYCMGGPMYHLLLLNPA